MKENTFSNTYDQLKKQKYLIRDRFVQFGFDKKKELD
jgi:hypothetical protein